MNEFDIYNNGLTNLSNSILKYYNVKPFHNSIELVDKILQDKKPDNVILILLDGLGSIILENHLSKSDFLIKNKKKDIYSVIPTTTTAATTSVMSAKTPIEHGWIGWDVYFKDINKIVTLFTNKLKDSKEIAEVYNVAKTKLPYKNFCELIKTQNSEINTERLFPFGDNKYETFNDAMDRVYRICNERKKNFIYVYYDDPDATMHNTGTKSIETHNVIKSLNNSIEFLSKRMKNAVILVVADHGHIDSDPIYLTDYPELLITLRKDISIESRACAFFVKAEKINEFMKIFNRNFAKDFRLFNKEEIIKNQIFGTGEPNKYFEDSIGDFVAFATSNKYFRSNRECKKFVSQHAGITKEELLVPLIII